MLHDDKHEYLFYVQDKRDFYDVVTIISKANVGFMPTT